MTFDSTLRMCLVRAATTLCVRKHDLIPAIQPTSIVLGVPIVKKYERSYLVQGLLEKFVTVFHIHLRS